MKFGIDIAQQRMEFDEVIDRARFSEELGFDGAWGFDHFVPMYGDGPGNCFEGMTTLAALAMATRRIRLGLLELMRKRPDAVFRNATRTERRLPGPTKAPPLPAPDVLRKAPPDFLRRRILLIKPDNAPSKCFPSRRRDASHTLLRNPLSEECKSPLNPPDERPVRVLLHPQFPERLVDHSNRTPKAPSRGGPESPNRP